MGDNTEYEQLIAADNQIRELEAENIRLRSLLKRLEWWYFDQCPVCRHEQLQSHATDCWLAKELEGK